MQTRPVHDPAMEPAARCHFPRASRHKRARQQVGLAVLLFLLGSSACALRATGGTSSNISADVRSRRQQWNVAFANRDSTTLAALVEESAVHVSPVFTHVGRSAYLSVFQRGVRDLNLPRPRLLWFVSEEGGADLTLARRGSALTLARQRT